MVGAFLVGVKLVKQRIASIACLCCHHVHETLSHLLWHCPCFGSFFVGFSIAFANLLLLDLWHDIGSSAALLPSFLLGLFLGIMVHLVSDWASPHL